MPTSSGPAPVDQELNVSDVKESPKIEEAGSPKRRRKLGEVLLEAGLLTPDLLIKSLEECTKSGKRLGEYLVEQDIVTEQEIAWRLSHQLGYLFVDLTSEPLDTELSTVFPESLAKRYLAVPYRL